MLTNMVVAELKGLKLQLDVDLLRKKFNEITNISALAKKNKKYDKKK